MSDLLRSNLIVATGTALSRLTGLLRVMVLAAVIGKAALGDLYRIGNETPNIVYELLLGGVLSATLVPLFTAFNEEDDKESTNAVITVASVALLFITAVALVAAPLVFGLYSVTVSGDVDADSFRRAGTMLTRIFLIQILFYGLTALASALLNSRRRFFAAAWSPVLANVITIAALLSLPNAGEAGWSYLEVLDNARLRLTLGFGATVGIAAMALSLVVAVRRTGFSFRPLWDLKHPAVRKLAVMSGWTLGYVVANQASVAVVRNLADPGSGDASAYFDAYTFFVLPHGLLAVSIATTFIPEMAQAVARRDRPRFVDRASLGIRLVSLLTLPAGILVFVLRRPIVGALLQHGEYTSADADITSRALAGFALGLCAFSVYLFVLRGFYAHHDTRTPFLINVGENALNILLAVILVGRYGVMGLGASFALAKAFGAVWAVVVLANKVGAFPLRAVFFSLARILLAGALGGEAAWIVARNLGGNVGVDGVVRFSVAGLVGLVVYVVALIAMRAPEVSAIRRRVRPGVA
ncbi:MAG: murein biosynthesis integral membrane protein MurJ [Actinomycetota bacterium]|nr:murein biosynthesis integral membrane protein MurJ [Actinomycetota bacterium]